MAGIRGMELLSPDQVEFEIQNGARFVIFYYTLSFLVITFRRGSDVFFVKKGEGTVGKSIGYTLLTFVLGWWGIPWGPIYTIQSLWVNLRGGKDVTAEIVAAAQQNTMAAAAGVKIT